MIKWKFFKGDDFQGTTLWLDSWMDVLVGKKLTIIDENFKFYINRLEENDNDKMDL